MVKVRKYEYEKVNIGIKSSLFCIGFASTHTRSITFLKLVIKEQKVTCIDVYLNSSYTYPYLNSHLKFAAGFRIEITLTEQRSTDGAGGSVANFSNMPAGTA